MLTAPNLRQLPKVWVIAQSVYPEAVWPQLWMRRSEGPRAVFGVNAEDGVKAATLELIGQAGESIECELILMSEWKTKVLKKLGSVVKRYTQRLDSYFDLFHECRHAFQFGNL